MEVVCVFEGVSETEVEGRGLGVTKLLLDAVIDAETEGDAVLETEIEADILRLCVLVGLEVTDSERELLKETEVEGE